MPVFFQHTIDPETRLGVWQIEEPASFFLDRVPLHREVSHPQKRLQHLAGRYLLPFLFPDFPSELVRIAETRRPFLPGAEYQFSLSHAGAFAAAIVSRRFRVGIDVEVPQQKIIRLLPKFLSSEEQLFCSVPADTGMATLLWCCKETVYKWQGSGGIDFRRQIRLQIPDAARQVIGCRFGESDTDLTVHYRIFPGLVLTWTVS
jgi:phosphopantetheinyl transferase